MVTSEPSNALERFRSFTGLNGVLQEFDPGFEASIEDLANLARVLAHIKDQSENNGQSFEEWQKEFMKQYLNADDNLNMEQNPLQHVVAAHIAIRNSKRAEGGEATGWQDAAKNALQRFLPEYTAVRKRLTQKTEYLQCKLT